MLSNTRELRSLRLAVGRVRRGDAGAKYNTGGDQQLHNYTATATAIADHFRLITLNTPHLIFLL